MELYSFVALILSLLAIWLGYRYFAATENFFKKQGITCVPLYMVPITFIRMTYRPLYELVTENYKRYGKLYGQHFLNAYSLVVADPEILRNVLVKDFQNFVDRVHFEPIDPIFDNMVSVVRGENWKRIRTIMSPTFSTGKIKKMTRIILDCSDTLRKNFEKVAIDHQPTDVKKFIGAFAMDTIASTAFATKLDSHNDPNNPFVVSASGLFTQSSQWRTILIITFNHILRFFNHRPNLLPTSFFEKITTQLMKERRKSNQAHNDYLQLLINASDKSREGIADADEDETEFDDKEGLQQGLKDGSGSSISKANERKGLSEAEIVSQCILFFIAGFDAIASAVVLALYELALNEDCQETLIQEVDEVFRQNNNELGYENIQNMKYMDCVVSETLRKYPPGFMLQRVALRDCKLADTNIEIPKGAQIAVPVYSIHHDEEYYPDPEKFDPNRFTQEEKEARNPYVYLPFGAGPRNCIAMRFALFEVKLCIATLLRHLRFRRCSKTMVPVKFAGGGTQLVAKDIFLAVEKREDIPK